jgi:hypothetical protein
MPTNVIFDPRFGAVPLFCVADTDQRNLIPFDQRREGCLAFVFQPAQVWQALPEPWNHTDSDWGPFCTGGYLAPAFTAFDIQGQATAIEVGDTILGTNRNFEWNTSNSGNVQANSISITDTTSSVVLASGLANDGTEILSFTDITQTTLANQIWTIDGVNTHGGHFNRTFEVDWLFNIYAGNNAAAVLNGAQILALQFKILQGNFNVTFNFPGGDYKFIATPSYMGDVNNFIDPATGFNISMADSTNDPAYSHVTGSGLWWYALVNVTNIFGVTIPYRLWRSTNILNGPITIRVS